MQQVKIEQGLLQGTVCENAEVRYIAFKGIPYAKPPIGDLRFKAPEPPESWEGVRDASEHGPVCPQYNERMECIDPGSEDCLYLNVYSASSCPAAAGNLKPVMVWIHGGAFYTGSGNSDFYGPEFFMVHNVILVTFNYRLEVLGFLCLDIEDVPGNAGLKDQVAALKWVKKNIAAFGGDPNNITIFGCSAGAASTSYHLISKMSEGLFNKAICQSGVCINEWGYSLYGRERAFQLGKQLGKDTEDPEELLQFLKEIPTLSLVNVKLPPLDNIKHHDITDGILFGPVIEKSNLKVKKFITDLPPTIVKQGDIAKVPIMLGYTSGEGIEIARKLPYITDFMNTVGAVVPRELKFKLSLQKIEEIDKRIRQYYFNNEEITKDTLQRVSNLETDKLFVYNIRRFARYHSMNSGQPVYLYKFSIESERNYVKKYYKMDALEGVCHADELHYLFNVTNLDIPLTEESRGAIKDVMQLWTNFAAFGQPTTNDKQWKPFTETKQYCYIIGKAHECVQNENENMKLWDDIYEENTILRN